MVKKMEHHLRTGCPIACALDVFGDHWTLLIIRDLMFAGRHEYKDMLASEEGISSNILSDRLKKLEENGVIRSSPHPKSARRKLYYLTGKGKDLVYPLIDIARWSEKHLDDVVNIPPDKKEVLVNNPDLMIYQTLEDLAAWERENNIHV